MTTNRRPRPSDATVGSWAIGLIVLFVTIVLPLSVVLWRAAL